jgi:hypothetical protein
MLRNPAVRSVFAVIDGLLLFFALEGVFFAVAFLGLHRSFDTDTVPYLACVLVWAIAAALLSGFVAGRVAGHSPTAHGVALAVPFLLLSLWNLNKGLGNRHTPFVVSINLFVPLALIWGSHLAERGRRRRAVTPGAGR